MVIVEAVGTVGGKEEGGKKGKEKKGREKRRKEMGKWGRERKVEKKGINKLKFEQNGKRR
jgi:hypothetical protein